MTIKTIGIDPGNEKSALLILEAAEVKAAALLPNDLALDWLREHAGPGCPVAIEFIQSYGMAVGREVFETCYWAGRFTQVAADTGAEVHLYTRPKIKAYVTGVSSGANDSAVRRAMLNRYGDDRKGGPLWPIKEATQRYSKQFGKPGKSESSSHLMAALAVATYHADGALLGGWEEKLAS